MNSKIKPSNHIEDFMSHTLYKKEKLQKGRTAKDNQRTKIMRWKGMDKVKITVPFPVGS